MQAYAFIVNILCDLCSYICSPFYIILRSEERAGQYKTTMWLSANYYLFCWKIVDPRILSTFIKSLTLEICLTILYNSPRSFDLLKSANPLLQEQNCHQYYGLTKTDVSTRQEKLQFLQTVKITGNHMVLLSLIYFCRRTIFVGAHSTYISKMIKSLTTPYFLDVR